MLVTVFQVKQEHTREHGFISLVEQAKYNKQDESNFDMSRYEVAFGETNIEGTMLFYTGRNSTDEEKCSKFFDLTNNPSEAQSLDVMRNHFGYKGRSISVSDIIRIEEENKARYYYCDSFGWKPIVPNTKTVPHWIYVGMGATGSYYSDTTPYEVIKVTPSGKTVTIRRMDYEVAEGHDYFNGQKYTYKSNPENSTETVRRNKWGQWSTPSNMMVAFGYMRKYQDPHF